jgi:hypothetical protein
VQPADCCTQYGQLPQIPLLPAKLPRCDHPLGDVRGFRFLRTAHERIHRTIEADAVRPIKHDENAQPFRRGNRLTATQNLFPWHRCVLVGFIVRFVNDTGVILSAGTNSWTRTSNSPRFLEYGWQGRGICGLGRDLTGRKRRLGGVREMLAVRSEGKEHVRSGSIFSPCERPSGGVAWWNR